MTSSDKPASGRIRGQNVGSPLKGWTPLDPNASKFQWYTKEIMLGLVVCFTQTPETIAFALSGHIDPSQGLHSAWILGVICAVFGGRPAMINGYSGASTSVFKTFLPPPEEGKTVGEGIEYIYPTVMLVGSLMILFGALRLGDFTINLIGSSVMIGFSCGLAITICKAQFHFYEVGIVFFYDMCLFYKICNYTIHAPSPVLETCLH
jgi:MFS superfamily sulfate permease-like transporter